MTSLLRHCKNPSIPYRDNSSLVWRQYFPNAGVARSGNPRLQNQAFLELRHFFSLNVDTGGVDDIEQAIREVFPDHEAEELVSVLHLRRYKRETSLIWGNLGEGLSIAYTYFCVFFSSAP
jgi:hypothetical protein